ncbi:hypothetical protein KIN20_007306 [Parelaphostrongylus tenuis]|uniref:Membrane-associated protein n=1 Tax=Parelaphostrongylus tenuis TaxID=148309 RepID=A0AAD5M597_PARTN|nr:hypothetical protein KIN20_007306 [Parelaphostrongylus tenuis]
MISLVSMAKVPALLLLIPLLTYTAVLGCGTLPSGPTAMASRNFNVSFSSLPVALAFSMDSAAPAQAVGISTSANAARALVMRTVMQAGNFVFNVFDVLEQQGRAAGLPAFITSSILNQLSVTINYSPLECKRVVVDPTNNMVATMMMKPTCAIFSNTVTALCNHDNMCMVTGANADMMLVAIPPEHLSFSGTLSTTNIIMANWSRDMWQSVVNRVARALALGPLGSHFFSAVATVS